MLANMLHKMSTKAPFTNLYRIAHTYYDVSWPNLYLSPSARLQKNCKIALSKFRRHSHHSPPMQLLPMQTHIASLL